MITVLKKLPWIAIIKCLSNSLFLSLLLRLFSSKLKLKWILELLPRPSKGAHQGVALVVVEVAMAAGAIQAIFITRDATLATIMINHAEHSVLAVED